MSRSDFASLDSMWTDPSFLLQELDQDSSSFKLVRTSKERLVEAPFLDSRFSTSIDGIFHAVGVDEVLQLAPCTSPALEAGRFIFHMSFCGSTLLARACNTPGKVLAYREPQVFADLAALKAAGHAHAVNESTWRALIDVTLRKFRVCWSQGEVPVVKPTNWANTILPELLDACKSRAVFLTLPARDFLLAVLRGGLPRITQTYNFTLHMCTAFPQFRNEVEEILSISFDAVMADQIGLSITMTQAVRLILLAHLIQEHAFRSVCEDIDSHRLTYEELKCSPVVSLRRVSKILELELSEDDIERNVRTVLERDAKQVDAVYDAVATSEKNAAALRRHGAVIDSSMAWYHRLAGAR